MALPGACSFGGVAFDVEAASADGFTDYPVRDETGTTTLSLTCLIDSHTDWLAFRALQSRVTVKPMLGAFAGRVYVQAGPGAKQLLIPTGVNGGLQTWIAVLTSVQGQRHAYDHGLYRFTASWVLL